MAHGYVLAVTRKWLPPHVTDRFLAAKASGHCRGQAVPTSVQKVLALPWLQAAEGLSAQRRVGVPLHSQGPGTSYLMKPPGSPSRVTAAWGTESRYDTWDNDRGQGSKWKASLPLKGHQPDGHRAPVYRSELGNAVWRARVEEQPCTRP